MSSYGTTADALTYHSDRGNSAWAAATTEAQDQARLRASEYIDFTYRSWLQGYKTGGRSQVREWPREDVLVWNGALQEELDSSVVPVEIEQATYEAALRELGQPGYLTPDVIAGKNKKSVSVEGAISVEYWSDDMKPMVEKIGMILQPLFDIDGGYGNPLVGKAVP